LCAGRRTAWLCRRLTRCHAGPLLVAQARSLGAGPGGVDARGGGTLAPWERDVVRLLAAGRDDSEIAAALFIGQGTVRSHLTNIYGKLDVGSRTVAVATARHRGILRSDPCTPTPCSPSFTFPIGISPDSTAEFQGFADVSVLRHEQDGPVLVRSALGEGS
jgi:DNA-binding CsgD family transcriptional regulator